jgi:hypothetical protein
MPPRLLLFCQMHLAHAIILQFDEQDDAFFAVERFQRGSGWLIFCRSRQERLMYAFPSRVADDLFVASVCNMELQPQTFHCPVWRAGDAARGAGEEVGGGGGCDVAAYGADDSYQYF